MTSTFNDVMETVQNKRERSLLRMGYILGMSALKEAFINSGDIPHNDKLSRTTSEVRLSTLCVDLAREMPDA